MDVFKYGVIVSQFIWIFRSNGEMCFFWVGLGKVIVISQYSVCVCVFMCFNDFFFKQIYGIRVVLICFYLKIVEYLIFM